MQPKRYDIGTTFGLPDITGREVLGLVEGHAHQQWVPQAENYIFRRGLVSDQTAWLRFGGKDGLYLTGPQGCGKSSSILQMLARLHLPAQIVFGHGRFEYGDLVGMLHPMGDGAGGTDMLWVDGPLTTAMRYGHILVIEEGDTLPPDVNVALNGVAEGRPLVIPENGGEMVIPAEGFRVVYCGNTNGGGDISGNLSGTTRQNSAFMDRFWVVEVDYPEVDEELAILASALPKYPEDVGRGLISVANKVRQLFVGRPLDGDAEEGGTEPQIELTMSTRTVLRWAMLTQIFTGSNRMSNGQVGLFYALDRALTNRAEPETRAAIHQIAADVMGIEQ